MGTIDLGALEDSSFIEFSDMWLTDSDQDGFPFGIEHALGTDPDTSNASAFSPIMINSNGHAIFTFPQNPSAVPGTNWIITRSTDLITFTEIWRYNGSIHTNATNITSSLTSNTFTVADESPPPVKSFYRFEAAHIAP